MTIVTTSASTEPQSSYLRAHWGNTLLSGVAAAYLFGPVVGICCLVANEALAHLHDRQTSEFWFPLDSKIITRIKDAIMEMGPQSFLIQMIMGAAFRALGVPCIYDLSTPLTFLFRVCLAAPVLEEVFFRGFLQEKIRDIQVLFWGEDADTKKGHAVIRLGLQAIAFGAAHYQSAWNYIINSIVIGQTTIVGAQLGLQKEMYMSAQQKVEKLPADQRKKFRDDYPKNIGLWDGWTVHTLHNMSVSTRLFLFGA